MNIIITGATKGIGRAIAEKFAKEGFDLALCARSGEDLLTIKEELSQKYPVSKILIHPVDLRSKKEVLAFAGFVKEHWQHVNIIVNNAGVFIPGEIQNEEDGVLEHMIETNLYSAYHLTRAILPLMNGEGKAHIFNMCSIASFFAYPNGGSYSISKFAMLGFSKVLREELKNDGIRVTALMPGATWTDSWAGSHFPEERLMKATDIAMAVWGAWQMSSSAVVESIVLRPQLGDL